MPKYTNDLSQLIQRIRFFVCWPVFFLHFYCAFRVYLFMAGFLIGNKYSISKNEKNV